VKPTPLYRIAAVLYVLLAAAHTVGFQRFVPPTADGVAVRDAMFNTHFALHGGTFSYGGFYMGFGISVGIYMLFAAFLAWHLGSLAKRDPSVIGVLGIVFCAMQVAQLVICLAYFFTAPIVFESVIALVLALAAWSARRQSPL
jgi:multisubunit Na+/H+ antiporter MnhF subunit